MIKLLIKNFDGLETTDNIESLPKHLLNRNVQRLEIYKVYSDEEQKQLVAAFIRNKNNVDQIYGVEYYVPLELQ